MKSKNRDIQIFSLSALDLFASAMGAFVLLSVMLLPYYFKGKVYETELIGLQSTFDGAAAKSRGAREAVEQKLAELARTQEPKQIKFAKERAALAASIGRNRSLKKKAGTLEKTIEAEKKALRASVRKVVTKTSKVSFRFLGLKTSRDSYLILVDGAARIKKRATNLPQILRNIMSVLGPQKKFAIVFYRYAGGRLVYSRWPQTGLAAGGAEARARAIAFMRDEYAAMGGGSATYQALMTALGDDADAIILVSDGVIFPKHNAGRTANAIVNQVRSANRGATEIHAVAIGMFYRHVPFAQFLNNLSLHNKGDFKAIPP